MLETTTRRADPRPAEPVGLDRGDGRQVARARAAGRTGRGTRRTPRAARRGSRRALTRSKRSSSASTRRVERRVELLLAAGRSSRRRLQPHAITPTPTAPTADEPSGSSHARRSKPRLRRLREHAWPELVDELGLDLRLGRARRDPLADDLLHPSRDRRVGLVERRLAGRADELRLEVGGTRGRRCRRGAARRARRAATSAASERRSRRVAECERDAALDGPVAVALDVDRRRRSARRRACPTGRRRTSRGMPGRPTCPSVEPLPS